MNAASANLVLDPSTSSPAGYRLVSTHLYGTLGRSCHLVFNGPTLLKSFSSRAKAEKFLAFLLADSQAKDTEQALAQLVASTVAATRAGDHSKFTLAKKTLTGFALREFTDAYYAAMQVAR